MRVRRGEVLLSWFNAIAFFILVSTALLKLLSVYGWESGNPLLGAPSVVFPFLSEGSLVRVASFLELLVALLIVIKISRLIRFGLLAWLSTVFLSYHYVLRAIYNEPACHCSGIWSKGLQGAAEVVSWGLLIGLMAVSWGGLVITLILRVAAKNSMDSSEQSIKPPAAISGDLHRIALMILCGSGMFSGPTTKAAEFVEIQLEISQTNFMFAPQTQAGDSREPSEKRASWTARCVFGLDEWMMEVAFAPNVIDSYRFDGTNVYHISVASKTKRPKPEAMKTIESKTLGNFLLSAADSDFPITPLTVTPGEHPLDFFGANLPWLAFCSGHYLREPGRLLPLTGADPRHIPWAFGFQDETETFKDDLGLPRKVALIASTELMKKSALHSSVLRAGRTAGELRDVLKQRAELPEGFLGGRYEVLAATNINGWNIPALFAYEQFLPAENDRPVRTLAVSGKLANARIVPEVPLLISVTNSYQVVDYRFRSGEKLVDEIHYGLSNGVMRAVNDPVLQDLFRQQLERAPLDPVIKAHHGIYGLFAALMAVPVIAACIGWFSRRKKRMGKYENTSMA